MRKTKNSLSEALNALIAQPIWAQFFYVLMLMTAVTTAVAVPVALIVKAFYEIAGFIALAITILAGLISWYISEMYRRRQIRLYAIYDNAPRLIFQVLSDAAEQLGTLAPTSFNDIFSPQGESNIGAAPTICFEVFKRKPGTVADYKQLLEYRSILQARIDKLLVTGNYIWLPFICVAPTSALTVIEVQDSPTMLYIHIAIIYDDKSARSIAGYQPYSVPQAAQRQPANTPAIPIAYDKALYDDDIKKRVMWPYDKAPHAAVIGATGSGKTYFTKQAIHTVLQGIPKSTAIICDFKADDFRFLLGREGYYQYIDCAEGLQHFYDLFSDRQSGADTCRDFRLLVFDEWASYLQSLDKKQAEGEMKKMATLLMLGRSFGCHVLVSQQRGDAQYFSTARDNFGMVIALGNLSPESRDMFFKGYKEKIELTQTQGTGYAAVNGGEPIAVQVRTVNMDKIETEIAQHFTPKPSDDAGEA